MEKSKHCPYPIITYWSEIDSVWISSIDQLGGCITHGNTPEESIKNVLEVYEEWVEIAKPTLLQVIEESAARFKT